jgi:hypothetical protein
MSGSLVSGFISVYLGFYTTFIASGILLFVAVWIVARLPKSLASAEGAHQ